MKYICKGMASASTAQTSFEPNSDHFILFSAASFPFFLLRFFAQFKWQLGEHPS
jgi:hypothetical protein